MGVLLSAFFWLYSLSAAIGVDGILAFPPYYPNADDEGMRHYYSAIAGATQLGMLIYARDWTSFGPSMVEQLTGIPNLVAWKDGRATSAVTK